ncbi:hypothetical protein KIW84_024047 [Lathyrus oleraceus]|uniref:PGG domain-containing protein n=1 Tax=Pisum sativum TaxID=3888 RepID=A0A9D4YKG0_PEA|nr:hypothetical protein KIW84_024047 [Pisum sativum]
MMKSTDFASGGIVHQALNKDNYERWSCVIQNYLQGQGLWDDVILNVDANHLLTDHASSSNKMQAGTRNVFRIFKQSGKNDIEQGYDCYDEQSFWREVDIEAVRKTKNAKALHMIQLSCGREIVDEISHFPTAKEAWNHLRILYGKEIKATAHIEQADLESSIDQLHKDVFRRVERGQDIQNTDIGEDVLYMTSTLGRTLLHVAVIAGNVRNVETLVAKGKDTLLDMQDRNGDTALALVARYTGNTYVAKCMVETNNYKGFRHNLLVLQNNENVIPILMAAANGHKQLTTYLYTRTDLSQDNNSRILLLSLCITAEIFDVALRLLVSYPDLPRESLPLSIPKMLRQSFPDKFSPLVALSKMPSAFPSGTRFGRLEQFFYDSVILRIIFGGIIYLLVGSFKWLNMFGIRKIYGKKYSHYEVIGILCYFSRSVKAFSASRLEEASAYESMLHGAQNGIIEFINAMREANPHLLSAVDSCHRGIFSHAVLHRKQNVFQLIHCLPGGKELFRYSIDKFGNNLLHLAAQLGPSSDRDTRPGAALQMQREIQWFKAVEKVVHPKFKEAKNGDGKKPYEILAESHEELVKDGEKWAKETATSFTIVGTLITTIMFAAAFTVPGGNNGNGLPNFLHDKRFITFLIADAFSLFTSTTSVLIFIGILTSRYAERDFLRTLPGKLWFGLLFLVLSVCSMIVAFCAAIDMILKGYKITRWLIIVPTMSLGSLPITFLVLSQLPLMYQIFHFTRKNPISRIKN